MTNFVNSLLQTIRYLFVLLRAFYSDKIIIGAYCRTVWGDQDDDWLTISYISFSRAPAIYSDNEYEMDDYGVLDDDVFYYATRTEFIKRLWTPNPVDGWRITGFFPTVTSTLD